MKVHSQGAPYCDPAKMRVYVGCDDSGYEAKQWILEYLSAHGYEGTDCGSGEEPSRYPWYAAKVAAAVSKREADRGILICGSGIGMSIAANKFKGVRAGVVTDGYSARLTRRHNDSNVLCLGGRMTGRWQLLHIVDIWLTTEYDGGHHQGSLELVAAMEDTMMNGEIWCPEEMPYPAFDWDPEQEL